MTSSSCISGSGLTPPPHEEDVEGRTGREVVIGNQADASVGHYRVRRLGEGHHLEPGNEPEKLVGSKHVEHGQVLPEIDADDLLHVLTFP
jgi:hypothetical protein